MIRILSESRLHHPGLPIILRSWFSGPQQYHHWDALVLAKIIVVLGDSVWFYATVSLFFVTILWLLAVAFCFGGFWATVLRFWATIWLFGATVFWFWATIIMVLGDSMVAPGNNLVVLADGSVVL